MIKLEGIDLFCGAGGTTTGIHNALIEGERFAKVVACVNHDETAIASHRANHPESLHFMEDIRTFNTKYLPRKNPDAYSFIWASLECTNFSNAKGGLPRDADSRTLANHLFRYIEAYDPDYIFIENVREFMAWGPLRIKEDKVQSVKGVCSGLKIIYDEELQEEVYHLIPKSRRKGEDYLKWLARIKSYGYRYDWRLLNSADFGAYTSRIRYFAVFAKERLPIAWPQPTHAKNPMGHLKPWKPVYQVLDLQNVGISIFGPNLKGKPYSDKTIGRAFDGLKKYYTDGLYLTSYYGKGTSHSADTACNTLTTKDRYATHFIEYDYSTPTHSEIEAPAGTLTTVPKLKLATVQWLVDKQYENSGRSVDLICQTLIARMDKYPIYLMSSENESKDMSKPVYGDSDIRLLMKAFMRTHGITDVKIRMLEIQELKRIQGFGDDYILLGSKDHQKKSIGNSVVPKVPQVQYETIGRALQQMEKRKLQSA